VLFVATHFSWLRLCLILPGKEFSMRSISSSLFLKFCAMVQGLVWRTASVAFVALSLASVPVWCQTTATVTVNATATPVPVGPESYGVDTAVYDNYLTSNGVASQLQAAGINAIRYPGGSYADIFNFISGTDQTLNGGYFANGDTFNNFMNDVVSPDQGSKAIITTNYGSNTTATGPALPSEAAAWVQYSNVTNNYGIVYWEIGNEVYGNGYYSGSLNWEEDLHVTSTNEADRQGNAALSPTAYGTNAAAFVTAMKAVDPSIKCGVFVNTAGYYTDWDKDVLTGISSALQGTGYTLDFVIVHWYPGGSNAQVLAAQTQIAGMVQQIRSDIKKYYTLSNADDIEIIITESGAPSSGGLFPFLFAADDYMTWLENGISNVEYQELHNGFLDNSNAPLGPWYGALFSSTVARVGDSFVSASSTNALLRVHAINRSDNQVGVVLINDDPNNSTTATVNITGATLKTSGTRFDFGNANYTNGSKYANSSIQQSSISNVGSNFTVTVPAYTASAILIPVNNAGTLPTITTLNPTSGIAGSSVTINGSNFGATQGSSTVSFGGTNAVVTAWSNTAITVTVPQLAAGAVNVVVDVNGAGSNADTFTVTLPPSFTLTRSAVTLSVTQGSNTTDTISVVGAGGFNGSVTLAASGLPSGVTAAFATNPATGSSLLTLTAAPAATTGQTTVTISGTSGTLSASTTITLTVNAAVAAGFTISGKPVSLAPGATTGNSSTITVMPTGNFVGNVVLTAVITTSPTGAVDLPTLTFSPSDQVNIAGGASGQTTLTITTQAPASGAQAAGQRVRQGFAAAGLTLACVLLFGIPGRRNKLRSMLGLLVLLAALTSGLTACGGLVRGSGSGGSTNPGTTPGTYTITVTGSSGITSATGTVTLTVQ
jgi:hypothetical protein